MSWAGPNGNNHPFVRPGGPQGLWNFIHSLDPNMRTGAGVDHSAPWANLPAGFPFHGSEFGFGGGPGGWGAYGGWGEPRRGFAHRRGGGRCGGRGHHGPHGRHGMNETEEAIPDVEEAMRDAEEGGDISEKEKDDSPDTIRDSPEEGPEHGRPHGAGRRGRGRHGRGPPGGDPWRHSRHHPHGPHGHRGPPPPPGPPPPSFGAGHHQPPPPPPPYSMGGGFDFTNWQEWLNQFSGHPFAQQMREWATRFGGLDNPGAGNGTRDDPDFANDDSSFTPPVDIFATDKSYVLHFALPGAKKDDIGVDWDAEKSELRVAGVVYRPGDEDFLATMASSERKIGMFSRSVPLPPAGSEREEIDALSITAKMEDGILVVTVPKLEKEWTEIHKVDIE